MSYGKVCGPDSIPTEVYRRSKVCEGLLTELLQKIWDTDLVPEEFARATFTMIYKNKGSSDDPTKYRCIGLLNHYYKVLSQLILQRLNTETDGYLAD